MLTLGKLMHINMSTHAYFILHNSLVWALFDKKQHVEKQWDTKLPGVMLMCLSN